MTLQEALLSGRKFRLRGWNAWVMPYQEGAFELMFDHKKVLTIRPYEILSAEWELDDPQVSITQTHYNELSRQVATQWLSDEHKFLAAMSLNALALKLGLEQQDIP